MEALYPLVIVVVAALPLAVTVLLARFAAGWRRWLLALLAAPVGGIFVFELYSGWVGGNLTGLIWMLSTPVVCVIVLLMCMVEWVVSRRAIRSSSGGGGVGQDAEPGAAADGGA